MRCCGFYLFELFPLWFSVNHSWYFEPRKKLYCRRVLKCIENCSSNIYKNA